MAYYFYLILYRVLRVLYYIPSFLILFISKEYGKFLKALNYELTNRDKESRNLSSRSNRSKLSPLAAFLLGFLLCAIL